MEGQDSTLAGMRLGKLELVAETATHRQLVAEARERADARARAAEAEAAREREAARQRELEALEDRIGPPTSGL